MPSLRDFLADLRAEASVIRQIAIIASVLFIPIWLAVNWYYSGIDRQKDAVIETKDATIQRLLQEDNRTTMPELIEALAKYQFAPIPTMRPDTPTSTVSALTHLLDSQRDDLREWFDQRCRDVKGCAPKLIWLMLRPYDESFACARDLYNVFDDVAPYPGHEHWADARDYIWWKLKFGDRGVYFCHSDQDQLGGEFFAKLSDGVPGLHECIISAQPNDTWIFWIAGNIKR